MSACVSTRELTALTFFIHGVYTMVLNQFETVVDFVLTNHPEIIPEIDFERIVTDPRVTWELVQLHPNVLFRPSLSINPNITIDIVLEYSFYAWNFTFFSMNTSVTWEIVLAHPEIDWNYDGLSQNDSIGWDVIVANPDKPWNWNIVLQKTKF